MEDIIKMPYEVIDDESEIILDADMIPVDEIRRVIGFFSQAGNIGLKIKDTIDAESDYILKIPKDIRDGLDKGILWFNEKKDGSGILPDVWGFSEEGKKKVQERLTVEKGVKDYGSLSLESGPPGNRDLYSAEVFPKAASGDFYRFVGSGGNPLSFCRSLNK